MCLYDLLICDTGRPRFIQTSVQSKRGTYKVSNMEWDFTYEPYKPYVKMHAQWEHSLIEQTDNSKLFKHSHYARYIQYGFSNCLPSDRRVFPWLRDKHIHSSKHAKTTYLYITEEPFRYSALAGLTCTVMVIQW